MIRIHIPGFYDSDSGGPRWGDAQIIDDGKNFEVIDGYCGVGTSHLIKALKDRNIREFYLYITHPHYDHRYGVRQIINDSYFKPKALYCQDPSTITAYNSDIKSDLDALKTIIREAKERKIPVHYLGDGDKIVHGEIKFTVYRDFPKFNGNNEAYLNDGSLCFWFPELKYLTTGDAGLDCAKEHGLNPILIKIGHHGNDCPRVISTWLYNHGTRYCWDNDYNTKLTDFLMTGREDCIAVGMKYFSCHGDMNVIFFSKKAVIYKDGNIYRYACSYNGKATLQNPTFDVVVAVLKGKAGANNERVTYLLNRNQNPGIVQNQINELYKLIKG